MTTDENKPTLKLRTPLSSIQKLKLDAMNRNKINNTVPEAITTIKHEGKKEARKEELRTATTDQPTLSTEKESVIKTEAVKKIDQKPVKKLRVPPEKIKEIFKFFYKNYPEAFSKEKLKPLAVGIHKQIKAITDLPFAPKEISIFLALYTISKQYKKTLIVGTNRVNLDGSVSSQVTDLELDYKRYVELKAQKQQEKIIEEINKKELENIDEKSTASHN